MAFAIDEAEVVNGVEVQVAGTYNEYVGTVASGTSITNVDWALGSGDRNYASGALTRVYIPVAAERENRIVEWGLVHADQDGTLKAGAVDNAAVLADDVVETAKIKDGAVSTAKLADAAVTNAKLSTAAGEINAASATWTPTVTAATGSFTTVSATGKYHKIGKRIFFDARITITAIGTGQGCVFTLPVAASATGYYACSGREDAVSGKMLQGRLISTTQVALSDYNNSNPSLNGAVFILFGCYEIA